MSNSMSLFVIAGVNLVWSTSTDQQRRRRNTLLSTGCIDGSTKKAAYKIIKHELYRADCIARLQVMWWPALTLDITWPYVRFHGRGRLALWSPLTSPTMFSLAKMQNALILWLGWVSQCLLRHCLIHANAQNSLTTNSTSSIVQLNPCTQLLTLENLINRSCDAPYLYKVYAGAWTITA